MLPDLSLTDWAAIGGLLAGVSGMLTALLTLLVVTIGRRRVQFWVNDIDTQWDVPGSRGNGGGDPLVRFTLSNVGDGTALRLMSHGKHDLHEYIPAARSSTQFRGRAIMASGDTIYMRITVPIEDWERARFTLQWRVAPLWPLVSRRRRTFRLARLTDRPRVALGGWDEVGHESTVRYFPTMDEAIAAQRQEEEGVDRKRASEAR